MYISRTKKQVLRVTLDRSARGLEGGPGRECYKHPVLMEFGCWGSVRGKSVWENMVPHSAILVNTAWLTYLRLCTPSRNLAKSTNCQGVGAL